MGLGHKSRTRDLYSCNTQDDFFFLTNPSKAGNQVRTHETQTVVILTPVNGIKEEILLYGKL